MAKAKPQKPQKKKEDRSNTKKEEKEPETVITLDVKPNMPATSILEVNCEECIVKMNVGAKPVNNAANLEIISFFKKNKIPAEFITGATSSIKRLKFNIGKKELCEKLMSLI